MNLSRLARAACPALLATTLAVAPVAHVSAKPAPAPKPAPGGTTTGTTFTPNPNPVDMRILVIAATGQEADLGAITQELSILGTPFTVYVASQTPGGLTADKLSSNGHGFYQGVILTNGDLGYLNTTTNTWQSALTNDEWQTLYNYEISFGVRQISWYVYPSPYFGLNTPTTAIDTTNNVLSAKVTADGQSIFSYLNSGVIIPIQYAYTYLATAINDGTTTPLLTDANGDALAAIHKFADGREWLVMTFDSNQWLVHSQLLSYGLIQWLTRGVLLGERHSYLEPQVDDVFIPDDEWLPTTPAGTPTDQTGAEYRMTKQDLDAVINWQKGLQALTVTRDFRLNLAFNGVGTTPDEVGRNDQLTKEAKAKQGEFFWTSHTYDHTLLEPPTDYNLTLWELVQNNQVAKKMGFKNFSTLNLVTPEISGLASIDDLTSGILQAIFDAGVRYCVSDTSRAGMGNPSPNTGFFNPYFPAIFEVPRHPVNLYYNVTTPAEWVAEYNDLYHNYWGRDLSYQEIVGVESDHMLAYLLNGDIDPIMFHQANLRAYDGTHTLLGDLVDATLAKYEQYLSRPILSLTEDQIAVRMLNRMNYNAAGLTATINPDSTITLTATKAAVVPITGVNVAGDSELYDGQYISYVPLNAGQSLTIPIQ